MSPQLPPSTNPHRPGSTLSTIGRGGRRLWQYPHWFSGAFMRSRTAAHLFLMGILLVGPWIDVAGHPAIFIDLPHRRAHFWGLHFFATDGVYLVLTLLFALFAIFLFTALFGRAWCGWACPQSVFLETLFRPIERWIEGSPMQRKRFDQAPWSWSKATRKLIKFAAFSVIAGAIGTTFVAYFLGRDGILEAQADPFAHPAGTAFFLAITALCLFDFAWFREQTCLVMCPYGRFQSVLLDQDSWGVGYDYRRGEPRGKASAKAKQVHLAIVDSPAAVGDCVDCRRCVQVCPTGIDIRNGPQLECVQCMACIDVCNDTMTKLRREQGLIRFDSERVFRGDKRRILRPRVVAYAMGLVITFSALALTISQHQPVEINIGRQNGVTANQGPDGRWQNALTIRISNKSDDSRTFFIELAPEYRDMTAITPISPLIVKNGEVVHAPLIVTQPATLPHREFTILVRDDHEFAAEHRLRFFATSSPTGTP